jgi:hypothetical protein
MVDGAARPGTTITLSHWPRSATPDHLRRDLSAQIVLAAMEDGYAFESGAQFATIDHYDEDGVVALGFLVLPGLAERYSDLLVETARVGDFGVVRDRRAALVAFSIAGLKDPVLALSLLDELAGDPTAHESLWRKEADAFDAASSALSTGGSIEELPEHDLAVVRIEDRAGDLRAASWEEDLLHPAAVNSATERLRIAVIARDRFEVRFRYESWVRMATFRPRLRVDLSRLAASLTDLEPRQAKWSFDGAGAIFPALRTLASEPSGIPADVFVEHLTAELAILDSGPPAWNPYV